MIGSDDVIGVYDEVAGEYETLGSGFDDLGAVHEYIEDNYGYAAGSNGGLVVTDCPAARLGRFSLGVSVYTLGVERDSLASLGRPRRGFGELRPREGAVISHPVPLLPVHPVG